MANIPPIQFKRSNAPGRVPPVESLLPGELAINLADRALYTKDSENGKVSIVGGLGSGILAVDSEGVLSGLDSDDIKHKESLIFLISEKKIVNWDSEADNYADVQLGGPSSGDVFEDFYLTGDQLDNPVLQITNTDILAETDSEKFIVMFGGFPLPRDAYELKNPGAWTIKLLGGIDSDSKSNTSTFSQNDWIRVTTVYTINNTKGILGFGKHRVLNTLVERYTVDSEFTSCLYVYDDFEPLKFKNNNTKITGIIKGSDIHPSDEYWYYFDDSDSPFLWTKNGPDTFYTDDYILVSGATKSTAEFLRSDFVKKVDLIEPGSYVFNLPPQANLVQVLALGGGGSGATGYFGGSGGNGGAFGWRQYLNQGGQTVSIVVGNGGRAVYDSDTVGANGGESSVTINGVTTSGEGGRGGRSTVSDAAMGPYPFRATGTGSVAAQGGLGGVARPYAGQESTANGEDGGEYNWSLVDESFRSGGGGGGGLVQRNLETVTISATTPGPGSITIPEDAFNISYAIIGAGGGGGAMWSGYNATLGRISKNAGGGGGGCACGALPNSAAGTTIDFYIGMGGPATPQGIDSDVDAWSGDWSWLRKPDGTLAYGAAGGAGVYDGGKGGVAHGGDFNLSGGKGGDYSGNSGRNNGANGNSVTINGATYSSGGGGGSGVNGSTPGNGGTPGGGKGGYYSGGPFASVGGTAGTGGGAGGVYSGSVYGKNAGTGRGGTGGAYISYQRYVAESPGTGGLSGTNKLSVRGGASGRTNFAGNGYFRGTDAVNGSGAGGGGGGKSDSPSGAGGSGRVLVYWYESSEKVIPVRDFYKVPINQLDNLFPVAEQSTEISFEQIADLTETVPIFSKIESGRAYNKNIVGTIDNGASFAFLDSEWKADTIVYHLGDSEQIEIDSEFFLGFNPNGTPDVSTGYYILNTDTINKPVFLRIEAQFFNNSNVKTYSSEATEGTELSPNTQRYLLPTASNTNNDFFMKIYVLVPKRNTSVSDAFQYGRFKSFEITCLSNIINTKRKVSVKRLK